mgnify:CR=1 FL=1
MIDKVPNSFQRIGIDYNAHTIEALIAIRDLVDKLPNTLTEDEYKQLKGSEPEPIKSWLRFTASFGGKFDNGYAREKGSDETTFIGYGKRKGLIYCFLTVAYMRGTPPTNLNRCKTAYWRISYIRC